MAARNDSPWHPSTKACRALSAMIGTGLFPQIAADLAQNSAFHGCVLIALCGPVFPTCCGAAENAIFLMC
jgi:hypothetical protein